MKNGLLFKEIDECVGFFEFTTMYEGVTHTIKREMKCLQDWNSIGKEMASNFPKIKTETLKNE